MNTNRKAAAIQGIVVHRGELTPTSPDWSAYHILIQPDGSECRLVPDLQVAPHACDFNFTTLAVCVFGDFAGLELGKNWYPTTAQLTALTARILRWQAAYGGKLWVAGHSELGAKGTRIASKLVCGHTCPGEHLDLNALRASGPWLPCPKELLS